MYEILKILHFVALMAGAAAGIGNMIIMVQVKRGDGPPPPMIVKVMGILGRLGLPSIVLLWLSGIGMVSMRYDLASLDWLFYVKLLGAATVLIGISLMVRERAEAARDKRPPSLDKMMSLGRMNSTGVIIAVVFAVLAFA